MKKPLLLLVDDDPAVLSALEAELTEAFGGVTRIESFEDPRAVLAALPHWNEERRPIATAIVDQRMPGMTGVELVAALRASVRAADSASVGVSPPDPSRGAPFHAARFMRAALLTGYAGLESALAARNEADVDRYVEKPWAPRILHTLVRKLLGRHVTEAGADRYLEFRELSAVDEIRRYLAMRYESYAASPSLRYLLPQYSRRKLDMDAYDTQSRFFAMFSIGADGEEQVGGLRLIGSMNPKSERAIVSIASEDDELRARAAKRTEFTIELPEKWPEPLAITRLLDRIRARGEGVVEAGRLVVLPTHRGRSLSPGQVVLGIYEGATTYVLEVIDVENVLQQCAQRHQGAASRMGFRTADGTGPMWNRRLQDTLVVLHGRASFMTDTARKHVRDMGRGVEARGGACRCATLPLCMGEPYASSDFRGTDLFCPRVAQELLVRPSAISGPPAASTEAI